jgi:hypothetical protein
MPFYKIIDAQVDPPTILSFVQADDEDGAIKRYTENRQKLGLSVDSPVKAIRGS